MATMLIQGDDLVIQLEPLEKLAAMCGNLRVPLSAVRSISIEEDPWGCLRGIRAPGTGLPGVAAYGVRRSTGDRPDFAAVHGRGPVVRVELSDPARFARLLVSVVNPEETVAAVQRGTAS